MFPVAYMGRTGPIAKTCLDIALHQPTTRHERDQEIVMDGYLPFPNIGPNLFSIDLFGFELALRYYALAYIVGLLLGFWIVRSLVSRPQLWRDNAPPTEPERIEGSAHIYYSGCYHRWAPWVLPALPAGLLPLKSH